MAFYRHFVERSDFDLLVATDSMDVERYDVPYPFVRFNAPGWLERVQRTRFHEWFHSYQHLIAGRFVPREVWRAARQFRPDLVFTIGGSWNWTAMMAGNIARRLGVPLVASFNDWFDYGVIIHPRLRGVAEKAFRHLYRSCDLALCTSEGMRDALGSHPNAHVLYPIGATLTSQTVEFTPYQPESGPARVAFTGNVGNWYGPMLERLVQHSAGKRDIFRFQIFGSNPSWSKTFDEWACRAGVFHGQLPFDKLRDEMDQADVLLLPMGFGESCAQVERTSFKTKFLDYVAFQKPIVVWGPDYCSAVRIAREFDSAECCTTSEAAQCLHQIRAVAGNPSRQTELVRNARQMYQDRFHPDKIHAGFFEKCRELIERRFFVEA
jgi:hypothetical protein